MLHGVRFTNYSASCHLTFCLLFIRPRFSSFIHGSGGNVTVREDICFNIPTNLGQLADVAIGKEFI